MSHIKIIYIDLLNFTNELLTKSNIDPDESFIIAKVFVWADQTGRNTQELW